MKSLREKAEELVLNALGMDPRYVPQNVLSAVETALREYGEEVKEKCARVAEDPNTWTASLPIYHDPVVADEIAYHIRALKGEK